jgi:hypothetical protein
MPTLGVTVRSPPVGQPTVVTVASAPRVAASAMTTTCTRYRVLGAKALAGRNACRDVGVAPGIRVDVRFAAGGASTARVHIRVSPGGREEVYVTPARVTDASRVKDADGRASSRVLTATAPPVPVPRSTPRVTAKPAAALEGLTAGVGNGVVEAVSVPEALPVGEVVTDTVVDVEEVPDPVTDPDTLVLALVVTEPLVDTELVPEVLALILVEPVADPLGVSDSDGVDDRDTLGKPVGEGEGPADVKAMGVEDRVGDADTVELALGDGRVTVTGVTDGVTDGVEVEADVFEAVTEVDSDWVAVALLEADARGLPEADMAAIMDADGVEDGVVLARTAVALVDPSAQK